jgi:hypothetical protein
MAWRCLPAGQASTQHAGSSVFFLSRPAGLLLLLAAGRARGKRM